MGDKCWAIIPARGGSTGVIGKNIKLLNNKPLIGYAIEALQRARVFEKIVVTSDSEEILAVAEDFGAEIYLRSDLNESKNEVMNDVPTASYLQGIPDSVRPKFCFMVQCTAPFITSDSYYLAHTFLWQRENEDNQNSKWLPINHPFHEREGRQFSKVQQVHETGAFYGFAVKSFLAARYRFFSDAYPILTQGDEIIDINDYDDWELAQFKTSKRES